MLSYLYFAFRHRICISPPFSIYCAILLRTENSGMGHSGTANKMTANKNLMQINSMYIRANKFVIVE